jgi:hypothetical protein
MWTQDNMNQIGLMLYCLIAKAQNPTKGSLLNQANVMPVALSKQLEHLCKFGLSFCEERNILLFFVKQVYIIWKDQAGCSKQNY